MGLQKWCYWDVAGESRREREACDVRGASKDPWKVPKSFWSQRSRRAMGVALGSPKVDHCSSSAQATHGVTHGPSQRESSCGGKPTDREGCSHEQVAFVHHHHSQIPIAQGLHPNRVGARGWPQFVQVRRQVWQTEAATEKPRVYRWWRRRRGDPESCRPCPSLG
jgi:hypothetical protein